jgi:hypothetical protein
MSETLDFGSDDTAWRRFRRRAAFAGATTVFVLLASEQSTAIHDDGYRHANTDSALPSTVHFAFEPHHQTIDFTPMGSVLARAGHDTDPVSVSFENIHCQQHQVWGAMDVYTGRSLDRFSNIALPTNSLIFDCLVDNNLDYQPGSLTVGASAYRYQIES